ncbi:hypothetical protein PYCC9005_004276 [Savitreella phatthalungensis]
MSRDYGYQQSTGFSQTPGYQKSSQSNVRNNNVLNPFSSNTTNPQHWGEAVPENLKSPKDYVEMLAYSYFFIAIYWTSWYAYLLAQKPYLLPSWWQWLLGFASIAAAAGLCFRQCEEWYEFSALEYWQPAKDIVKRNFRRRGPRALVSIAIVLFTTIVCGPFFVATLAYVDELGTKDHAH